MSHDQTHPPGAHPDLDTLADLQEGLLAPTPAAAISDHLNQCASCQADFAALGEIPARLAAAAEVGGMPAQLASRLDEALAAQPRTSTVTITPMTSARRNPVSWDNRVLQVAAAAVLVLAATAIGVAAVQEGGSQTTSKDSAAGTGAREFAAGSVSVLSTGSDYTQASVVAAVPRLLVAGTKAQQASPDAQTPTSAAADSDLTEADTRLRGGPALSACVIALSDDPDTPVIELPTPLAVDVARFDGKPATVIVLPAPGQADRLDVYVVGPTCGPADAKLLHFARVVRP